MTPSTKWTRDCAERKAVVFPSLLMRHGAPPAGVKFYGEAERMRLTSAEARSYVNKIIDDIFASMVQAGYLDHTTVNYRKMMARSVKNKYLRWWYEYRKHNS